MAVANGWILKNPFAMGKGLINPGDEKQRDRILSPDEEKRLLAACIGPRAHLKPIVICALDTGMRRGEIFKLEWSDIDFANRIITIRAFNTKTMRERQIAMTERLTKELEAMHHGQDGLVFGITYTIKTAFNRARNDAGISDVRFPDLRHTHATRLVNAHIPLSEVGRALGHTLPSTTYPYVNATVESARRAAAVLDELNKQAEAGRGFDNG